MKNKKKMIILIIIISIIAVSLTIYKIVIDKKEAREIKEQITKIKDSYAPFVHIKKDKKIFKLENNTYKEVGTIYKDTIIPLQEKKVKNQNDIYYKVKDTDYYIDYKNIEKYNLEEDTTLDNYISNNLIKTNETKLYQNDKLKIELNEPLEFDILLMDDEKYYIKYLNQIYYIKDSYEIVPKDISVNLLKDITVLSFDDNITNQKLDEVLKYLRDNNYESITLNDFDNWINKKVNLEDKKVLLLSYKELDNDKLNLTYKYNYNINTDISNIEFTKGDTKLKIGDSRYYKYEVTSNTTIDRLKDMLNGIKEKTTSVQKIAVLNYHFFYDSSIGEACNESICIDVKNFRKQLDYLKDNGYKTLTMKEFNDWMDKKITLPDKSVLITIDDGAMGTSKINGNKLIPILEEYQMHATLFLITGWWDIENYRSDYLEIESHGDELHHNNYCNDNGCGYKGLKLSKEEIKTDLELSISKIGSNIAFCYPFYAKNNTMVEAIKETGFRLAFVGGNQKTSQSTNKYNIPRYVVYKNTSLENFINMVK